MRRERAANKSLEATAGRVSASISGASAPPRLSLPLANMRMPHRKWLVLGGLLTLILVGVIFLALGHKEPTYNGKELSKWLNELAALDYSKRWDLQTEQAQAVRAIGTNALPWLFSQLRARGSRWPWQLNKLLAKQSIIKYRFLDADARLRRATAGFQALGELARPAIPTLLSVVEDTPGYVPDALAAIGPAAVPALQQCLTNTRSYATSVGQIILIPGNTIGAIHNAINAGRLSRSDVAVLMPAIRDWAQSTNRSAGQYNYAAVFLRDFDH